jgi:3',5'-cyclic AMP phosphodiesterase CpdA
MFVLAHLSDPHIAPPAINPLELFSKRGLGYLNWLRKRRRIHRPEVLDKIVADLKAQRTDHVAVTGDLVNFSLSGEFGPARAWLDRLGKPHDVTVVPGNHDAYVRATAQFAQREWVDCMRGDENEIFPFVRRRGPIAIVGLSSALPTWPFAAIGRLGAAQLTRLGEILAALGSERLFRVVLIHHPPVDKHKHHLRRLVDAEAFIAVLGRCGTELVLHGHLHGWSHVELDGPSGRIPVLGVPSASGAHGHSDDPAGYNLYSIDGAPGAWRCEAVSRGFDGDAVVEIGRRSLAWG